MVRVPAQSPQKGEARATIRFGRSIGEDGDIAVPSDQFSEGQPALWVADFADTPGVPTIRLVIVQVLADGREFEHWREDIALADPAGRRLVGGAVLSVFVHGGEGSYRLRYFRGDELLAEGAFEFAP